jgi:hypothetical protein
MKNDRVAKCQMGVAYLARVIDAFLSLCFSTQINDLQIHYSMWNPTNTGYLLCGPSIKVGNVLNARRKRDIYTARVI